jgi:hypothetical protein
MEETKNHHATVALIKILGALEDLVEVQRRRAAIPPIFILPPPGGNYTPEMVEQLGRVIRDAMGWDDHDPA